MGDGKAIGRWAVQVEAPQFESSSGWASSKLEADVEGLRLYSSATSSSSPEGRERRDVSTSQRWTALTRVRRARSAASTPHSAAHLSSLSTLVSPADKLGALGG